MARKWRPQVFEDVAGQNHVIRTLQNAVKLDRIAHAFIFSGPRGVGKTSVARILAKALNCEQGPTPTPCQVCTHCREITEGIALDVHEIDGASNRGIDEIRELRENIKFLPASSRYKVYIIDEVHMLTREAFNALLKTLEEPPPHVVFIFATTETHKIPATILSRCQCFDFRRISLKEIGDNLRTIAAAEGIAISDKGLSWIATAGDGSMRDSQSIFDQIVSYAGTAIADGNIEEILGLTDRRFVITIAEAVLARNAAQCLKLIDEGYYAGLDMQVFYQMLVDHFRNLVLTKVVTGAEGITEMTQEDWSKLQEQTGKVSRETLQRLLEILMAEEETMRRTQSPRLVLEMALTRMAYLAPLIPIDEILARMASLERSLASGAVAIAMATGENSKGQSRPVTEVKGTGDSVVPTPPISIAAVREQAATGYGTGEKATAANANGDQSWEGFKAFVKPPLSSKLDPGQLLSLEGDLLTIGFQKDYLFFEDIEKNQKEVLSKLARSYFQRPELEIKIEALHNDSAGNNGKIANGNGKAQLISDIRQEALKHPLVQKVMDIFENAEIRDVIPRQTVTEGEVE